jgi:hypothetical protein
MDSPSALALLLTLFLALCSALAFVLIYLRSPWHRAAVAQPVGKTARTTPAPPLPMHLELQQGTLAHALGPTPTVAPPPPQPAPLTAADLALRGRKAKKRGGRVHVTVAPSVSTGGGRSRTTSSATHAPYVYPLDFLSAAPPVIVCLTTIPSRVHHIDKCLNSIKTQNYPIAQMMLAIPEESRREHTKYR